MKLPDGWRYVASKPHRTCPTCGHTTPPQPGTLHSPNHKTWSLIGNRSQKQERDMITAIVEAHR